MGFFTRKKHPTPISGDIEMRSIPSAKKLGKKKPKSVSIWSRNATISSVSAKRLTRFRANQIYSKRVRYSRCRGLAKEHAQIKEYVHLQRENQENIVERNITNQFK